MDITQFRLLSFSRRIGKSLRPAQKQLMAELLPKLSLSLPALPALLDVDQLFGKRPQSLWMEIGFGSGEHLAMQAEQNPDVSMIGCEPYINGVVQLLKHVESQQLDNIRLWTDDAVQLLEQLPDQALGRLFILFPDPWPKVRHHKRRIISDNMLDLVAKKLQIGGELRLATDHVEYAEWMQEHLQRHPKFAASEDTHTPPADWIKTRYQEKAEKEGRPPIFFRYLLKGRG
jgi:tRNA (guanine-N7-)-methyltransferase